MYPLPQSEVVFIPGIVFVCSGNGHLIALFWFLWFLWFALFNATTRRTSVARGGGAQRRCSRRWYDQPELVIMDIFDSYSKQFALWYPPNLSLLTHCCKRYFIIGIAAWEPTPYLMMGWAVCFRFGIVYLLLCMTNAWVVGDMHFILGTTYYATYGMHVVAYLF